jgi:uncharacterized protein
MSEKVLITGGTGLIGNHLIDILSGKGFDIEILSRASNELKGKKCWKWDVQQGFLDPDSILTADHIIHLAGSGLSDRKWTPERKKEILESRARSTDLLFNALSRGSHHVKTFISASAIGYYGWNTGTILVDEDRKKPGDDFIATVVKEWESSALKINTLGIRTVILRFGLVLTRKGGVLGKLMLPVKFGLSASLGSGEQYMSWVHIEDLCGIITEALNNTRMQGVFNAVSPEPVTNKKFMKTLARSLHKPAFLPNVPSIILKLLLGEMASMVLGGNNVSSKKIESTGFKFKYDKLELALKDLTA